MKIRNTVRPTFWRALPVALALVLLGGTAATAVSGASAISRVERISVATDGTQGSDDSTACGTAVSDDGRFVAFSSTAPNLVPGDTNGVTDVFVHDRRTRETTRVSVATDGTQANGPSGEGCRSLGISGDGHLVAFSSAASNLASSDTNNSHDVFIHDLQSQTTARVSITETGLQGNGDSGFNGVALASNGRFVAFHSAANNLVPNDTNGRIDVFVKNLTSGLTTRVSVASDGAQANGASRFPAITSDGVDVAFVSAATNLVPDDTNGVDDVFVHNLSSRATGRVSVATGGAQGEDDSGSGGGVDISDNGRFVVFHSFANNLDPADTQPGRSHDVFIHDRSSRSTRLVSAAPDGPANGPSEYPVVSGDGRYVAFHSAATNLTTDDTNASVDIYVRAMDSNILTLVSVNIAGTSGSEPSLYPAISDDGCYVAFSSSASNLVSGDTNGQRDTFIQDRGVCDAELDANYASGAPGSYFTISGSGFPPSSSATIQINATTLLPLPTDLDGNLRLILSTSAADEGRYFVTAEGIPGASATFVLDASAPVRPQEGMGPVIPVPSGIAFANEVLLPFIRR